MPAGYRNHVESLAGRPHGFFDGYNESFTEPEQSESAQPGYPFWVDRDYLGIDQGPIVPGGSKTIAADSCGNPMKKIPIS